MTIGAPIKLQTAGVDETGRLTFIGATEIGPLFITSLKEKNGGRNGSQLTTTNRPVLHCMVSTPSMRPPRPLHLSIAAHLKPTFLTRAIISCGYFDC